jgi:hypothetical protein
MDQRHRENQHPVTLMERWWTGMQTSYMQPVQSGKGSLKAGRSSRNAGTLERVTGGAHDGR